MKNMRKSLCQVIVCLRKISTVFELQFFFSNHLKDLVRKSKIMGTLAETVDISPVVHHSLRDQFVSLIVTEERFQFEPIINTDSFLLITSKKQCRTGVLSL